MNGWRRSGAMCGVVLLVGVTGDGGVHGMRHQSRAQHMPPPRSQLSRSTGRPQAQLDLGTRPPFDLCSKPITSDKLSGRRRPRNTSLFRALRAFPALPESPRSGTGRHVPLVVDQGAAPEVSPVGDSDPVHSGSDQVERISSTDQILLLFNDGRHTFDVLKEVFLNEELRNGIYISSSHPCNYMPNQLQALWLLGQGMHYMDPHGHRLYLSEVDIGEIIVQFIRLRHLTHGMYIGGTVGQSISHLLSIFPESGNWDGSSSAFVSELSDFLSEEPVRQCIENETFVDFFLQRYSDGMRDVPKEQVMQASLHDICFALRRVSNARDGWFAHLELVQFAAGEGGSAGEHEGSGDDVRGQAGVEDSPGDDVHGQAATEHEEEEYEYEYEEDCDA